MKTIRHILISMAFLFGAATSFADEPLSKALVEKFFSTMEQAETLSDKYPDIDIGADVFFDGGEAFEEAIKKSGAYKDLLPIVKKNGFKSVEDMGSVMSRLMAAMFAIHYEKDQMAMPDSKDVEKMIAEQKKQYLAAGMPEAEVEKMLETMNEMYSMHQKAKAAAENIDPADLKFVRENMAYLEQKFESEEDGLSGNK